MLAWELISPPQAGAVLEQPASQPGSPAESSIWSQSCSKSMNAVLKALPSRQSASQALINLQSCVGEERSCDSLEGGTRSLQLGVVGVDGPNPALSTNPHQTRPQHHEDPNDLHRSRGLKLIIFCCFSLKIQVSHSPAQREASLTLQVLH